MLRSALRTLREPRYAALGALMLVVALVCCAAGTWQIYRFESKRHANDALRANAHRSPVGVAQLLPVGGRTPGQDAVEFRAVTATGRYDASGQRLIGSRTIGDTVGFLVVTPLRTPGGTLLVVRGFVPDLNSGRTPSVPAPPAGPVTVVGRVHPPETGSALDPHRYTGALYNGYVELEAHQPGGAGLTGLPGPDLSNPAGGALEPQHFAYVIQWYLFALLALAAPFAMIRADRKERAADDEPHAEPAVAHTDADRRAAKLADRYGRVPR